MSQTFYIRASLVCIVLLGAFFRLEHIQWDQGLGFHPDERNIALAVQEVSFPQQFNPKFYAYGTVPIYAIRFIAQTLQSFTHSTDWTQDIGHITLIGRLLSCAASIITIPLVYLLARSILPLFFAVLVAFFVATTPILIQHAHFSVTESAITCFAVFLAWIAVRFYEHKHIQLLFVSGIVLGFSLATKVSSVVFDVIPVISCVAVWSSSARVKKDMTRLIYALCYLGITTLFTYILFSSVTFIYPFETLESLLYEKRVATGQSIVFYTYQFIGTKSFLFQLSQLPYTIGYPLTIAAMIGCFSICYSILWKRNVRYMILFIWMIIYGLSIGTWHAKFVRYVVPMYPFLIIAAMLPIAYIHTKIRAVQISRTLIIILLIIQLGHAIAFHSIYTHPQTRIQALSWIEEHTPKHAVILADDASEILQETSLDESIDVTKRFVKSIPHFGLESLDGIAMLSYYLSHSDYYVIGSRRQFGVVMQHTDKFPLTSHFYSKLFSGDLGYALVATFTSYPTLNFGAFTVSFPDDTAEETVQVFDHPTIYIFKNEARKDDASIFDIMHL